jgi:hypothetical protein
MSLRAQASRDVAAGVGFAGCFGPSHAGSDQRGQAARMDADALFFLGIRRHRIRCLSLAVDLLIAVCCATTL